MGLNTQQLEAFSELVQLGSFSLAAKKLFITQSALSQRIQNLERELETGLIIRDSAGIKLTLAGERLARYCLVKESLETEFLNHLTSNNTKELAGLIRIAGFSSVMRSVILPSLEPLIKNNSKVSLELKISELYNLHKMLAMNMVDMIITTNKSLRQDIVEFYLGSEENVLVQGKSIKKNKTEVYFDHDIEDRTTFDFFSLNKIHNPKLNRQFLSEVYTIMDAVKCGWGRAVLPKHLIKDEKKIVIVEEYNPLKIPVFLHHHVQPYYPKLQLSAREYIALNAKKYLVN